MIKDGDKGSKIRSNVDKRLEKLLQFRGDLKDSSVFLAIKEGVCDLSIEKIRCLALGSPMGSIPALYQLALLVEIKEMCGCMATAYDPVFTEEDTELLSKFDIKVEAQEEGEETKTVFFVPHGDLELTETLISSRKPKFYLGNDIISHTNRMTKRELHRKYVYLSHMVDVVENEGERVRGIKEDREGKEIKGDKGEKSSTSDGFSVVKSKKNRNKFTPPKIEYDHKSMYFSTITQTHMGEYGEWMNAFNDLTLHVIE